MEKNNKLNLNLTGNKLKLIAVICMIIDHIGYFFASKLSSEMYITCRCIGRIAMPIFTFLLIEGFFHTSNLKRYVLRIFSVAIITQMIIIFFNYINTNYFSSKINNIKELNILFSFAIILLILRLLDGIVLKKKININAKNTKVLDYTLRILGIVFLLSIYFVIKIDYGICLSVMAIILYLLKKVKITKEKNKKVKENLENNNNNNNNKYLNSFLEILVIMIFSIIAIKNIIGIFASFAYIPISMYNGKKGKKSKILSGIYYLIFPLQYIVIYGISILVLKIK